MSTLKLRITGMGSPDDERRVEDGIRAVPGVLGVVARRRSACAEVEYEDDELSLDHLLVLVRDLGYPVELVG